MIRRVAIVLLASVAVASAVNADEVQGVYHDLTTCDNHGSRDASEELGDPAVFSKGQQIDHVATFTDITACVAEDDPNVPNRMVVVTNRTNRSWTDLYYVGDPATSFSNVDGFGIASGAPLFSGVAFRIDSVGFNRPLVAESMTADNVFEPGEEWRFVVQDYASPLGPPDSFFSVGFAGDSISPNHPSAASIVHFVPEPAIGLSSLLGALMLVCRNNR